ncbi:MAG: extracellular solute-binding protein [Eubacteriales bacterium]|nr:extracellular solute-binding protein [Eubacteriales bacterium]
MKTTFKRIACALLALCVLGSSALAEERPPLRLGDNIAVSKYWKSHGIPTTDRFFAPFATGEEKLAQLRGKDAPDLFGLNTRNDDLEAFKAAGVLADLSGSEIIREATARMRPETRRLVTTEDGRIVGMPSAHVLSPLYWNQEAWDAAGLTEADVPQSYTELLDFLEKWMARASGSAAVCVIAYPDDAVDDESRDCAWLVGLLLDTWEMQRRHAQERVIFDTPEFIALAERARGIGQRLSQSEPALKKRRKMPQLFYDETQGPHFYAFDGRDYGLSHTVPMRIVRDQPALTRAEAVVQCVRAGSEWLAEALAFMAEDQENVHWALRYSLYPDFAPGEYEGGRVSAGWMADLAAYDGTIVYLTSGFEKQKEKVEIPFAQGNITAKQLAEGMDAQRTD